MSIRRTTAATAVAAALLLVPVGTGTADAAPRGKSAVASQVRSQVKQALKDIAVKDKALARVEGSKGLTRLADDDESVLVASIESDRADLADLRADAAAADTRSEAKAVRAQVRGFRVEVYTQAVGIVRHAEELEVEAADDEEALALVEQGLDAALALHSHSPKAAVRAARTYLDQAEAELLDVDEPVEDPDA